MSLSPAFQHHRPSRQDAKRVRYYAERVGQGEEDAASVAELAVRLGFMLIGTTVSKKVHYPVAPEQHMYGDLRRVERGRQPIPEAIGQKMLHAGYQSQIAILTGLFGDLNDSQQRRQRAKEMGLTQNSIESRFGWAFNMQKSRATHYARCQDALVNTHASPQAITRARDVDNPLPGVVDVIYPHSQALHIAHDIGQYLIPIKRYTIASIPLLSTLDLPFDIVPTDYDALPPEG